ncbi:hypothetical protein ARMGADRAFT_1090627 [Armillaria gallica]|uniref:Uncharacterized protein n=1 Tax=Armillaria gallica TaxID=47427 RepID=A0A2H3D169_ARMGA|nr:hypothetical protein ARMGADRAFT_1090627 [Armillaria gallica]
MSNIETNGVWWHALEASRKVGRKIWGSNELTRDWDTRTSAQVFRQQRSLAMYWERGTEPDIYALGRGNGSIKSKIQAVTRCILEAARKVLSKKKCQTDTAQYEDGESFMCGAGADADSVGSTVAERDD